jgi:hypothetical protein
VNGIAFRLADGRDGRALRYAQGVLECVCGFALAPGQPFAAACDAGDGVVELRGKAASSKRRDDGSFDVRVRLHSLRKEDRQWLEQTFASGS